MSIQKSLEDNTLSACIHAHFAGDIVDAKDRFQIGSEQYVEEWEIYQKVLNESAVGKKTQWLEVRGNHGMRKSRENLVNYTHVKTCKLLIQICKQVCNKVVVKPMSERRVRIA